MRDYAKVVPRFWLGATGKALRQHGPEAQLVALYLLTSPHANMLGLYYQPLLYLAHETGLGLAGARQGLAGAVAAGLCSFDEATEMVWVHEMAAHQVAPELKAADKRCAGIQKDYDALPDNPFLGPFFDRYARAFHLVQRRGGAGEGASHAARQGALQGPSPAPSPAPAMPLASQEQEQEQEQQQEVFSAPAGAAAAPLPVVRGDKKAVKEELWQAGRSVLTGAGVPPAQAGSFLGSLVQAYGQPLVLDAVRAAVLATPAEPREYLKATCQRLAGERRAQAASASPAQAARAARMAEAVPGLAVRSVAATPFMLDLPATEVCHGAAAA